MQLSAVSSLCIKTIGLLLGLSLLTSLPSAAWAGTDFGDALQQAVALSQQGQSTKAIATLEAALPLADEAEKPTGYNNVAALYMKRAAYYRTQEANTNAALSDYRLALFYLEGQWPLGVARNAVQQANWVKAQQQYSQLFGQVYPEGDPTVWHLQEARQLREAGEFKAAVEELLQALKREPNNLEAAMALGDVYNVLQSPPFAAKAYQRALALAKNKPEEADLTLRYANALYKNGQDEAALDLLNHLLENDPDNAVALRYVEQYWRRALEAEPQNVLALANLGTVFQKKSQWEDALRCYEQAERLAGDSERAIPIEVRVPLRLNLGSLYLQMGQYSEASTIFQQVLAVDAYHPKASAYWLKAQQLLGQPQAALTHWVTGLQSQAMPLAHVELLLSTVAEQPNEAQLEAELQELGEALSGVPAVQRGITQRLLKAQRFAQALPYAQRWQQLAPNEPSAFYALATTYKGLGQAENSQAALARANALKQQAQTKTNTPAVQTGAAKVALSKKQVGLNRLLDEAFDAYQSKAYERCITLSQQVIAQDATQAMAYYYKGLGEDALKRYSVALISYTKAVEQNPFLAEAHYAQGVAYLRFKAKEKALRALQRFVELVAEKPVSDQQALTPQVSFAKQKIALLATPASP
jgi:tetratricopeptide (TPR) repeat protein